jgi:hypothetical protein
MVLIADILLICGAFGAAAYCYILALRIKKFQTLEGGMGGAIAVLSAQVDDLTQALDRAQTSAKRQATELESLTKRSEAATTKLELLLASLHDLPTSGEQQDEPDQNNAERRLRFVRRRSAGREHEAVE